MPSNVTNPNSVVNPGAGRLPAATVPASALMSDVGNNSGPLISTSYLYVNTLVLAPLFDSAGTLEIGTQTQLGLTMGRATQNSTLNGWVVNLTAASTASLLGSNVNVGTTVSGTNAVTVGNAPMSGTTKTYILGNTVEMGVDVDTTNIKIGTTLSSPLGSIVIGPSSGTASVSVQGSTVNIGTNTSATTNVGTGTSAVVTVGANSAGTTTIRGATISIGSSNTTTALNIGTDLASNGVLTLGEASSTATQAQLLARKVYVANHANVTDIGIGTTTSSATTIGIGNASSAGTVALTIDANTLDIGSDSNTTSILIGTTLKSGVAKTLQFGTNSTDQLTTRVDGNVVWIGSLSTSTYMGGQTITIGDEGNALSNPLTKLMSGDVIEIGGPGNNTTRMGGHYVEIGKYANTYSTTIGHATAGGSPLTISGTEITIGNSAYTTSILIGSTIDPDAPEITIGPDTGTTYTSNVTTLRGSTTKVKGRYTDVGVSTNATSAGSSVTVTYIRGDALFLGGDNAGVFSLVTTVDGRTINIGNNSSTTLMSIGRPGLTTNVFGTLSATTLSATNASFTNALPVGSGGTGRQSLSAGAVLLGNATAGITVVAPSTAGRVLTSTGTTWQAAERIEMIQFDFDTSEFVFATERPYAKFFQVVGLLGAGGGGGSGANRISGTSSYAMGGGGGGGGGFSIPRRVIYPISHVTKLRCTVGVGGTGGYGLPGVNINGQTGGNGGFTTVDVWDGWNWRQIGYAHGGVGGSGGVYSTIGTVTTGGSGASDANFFFHDYDAAGNAGGGAASSGGATGAYTATGGGGGGGGGAVHGATNIITSGAAGGTGGNGDSYFGGGNVGFAGGSASVGTTPGATGNWVPSGGGGGGGGGSTLTAVGAAPVQGGAGAYGAGGGGGHGSTYGNGNGRGGDGGPGTVLVLVW